MRNGQRYYLYCARTGYGKEGYWDLNPEFYKKRRNESEKKRKMGEEEDVAPVGALGWQPPSEMGGVVFSSSWQVSLQPPVLPTFCVATGY